MRLLLDECVPRRLKRELPGHEVQTVQDAGWAGLKNGALLLAADGLFDVLLTVEQGIETPLVIAAVVEIQAGQIIRVGG